MFKNNELNSDYLGEEVGHCNLVFAISIAPYGMSSYSINM